MEISQQVAQECLKLITSGKDFVVAQAPDVIQQLLVWKTLQATMILCILVLPFVVFGFILPYVITKDNRKEYGWDSDTWGPIAVCWIPNSIIVSFAMKNLLTIIQIHYAPKIFLMEYLSQLIK